MADPPSTFRTLLVALQEIKGMPPPAAAPLAALLWRAQTSAAAPTVLRPLTAAEVRAAKANDALLKTLEELEFTDELPRRLIEEIERLELRWASKASEDRVPAPAPFSQPTLAVRWLLAQKLAKAALALNDDATPWEKAIEDAYREVGEVADFIDAAFPGSPYAAIVRSVRRIRGHLGNPDSVAWLALASGDIKVVPPAPGLTFEAWVIAQAMEIVGHFRQRNSPAAARLVHKALALVGTGWTQASEVSLKQQVIVTKRRLKGEQNADLRRALEAAPPQYTRDAETLLAEEDGVDLG